jgi:hypothetical protein
MNEKELIRKSVALTIAAICSALIAMGQNVPTASVSIEKRAAIPLTGKHEAKLSVEKSDTKPPVIVVGFVGGFVGHNNMVHSPVQLAARLRDRYPSGVHVKVFENHRREDAHREILKLLDADHDGTLSDEEKRKAQIVIYGMSWGGSETVTLAKELDKEHIPVLLTIQVDSVAKIRQNDAIIPGNVGEAVNFYQSNGLIRGQPKIRAADEKRTHILGNYRFDYKSKNIECKKYPWFLRVFAKYHTRIECDTAVWSQVESLIRSKLPPNGVA